MNTNKEPSQLPNPLNIPLNAKITVVMDLGASLKRLIQNAKYREGVLAQVVYVGAQIMCWTYIYQYAEPLGIDNRSAVTYAYWALGVFLVGRFVCTF